jgi:hypothetical protein
MVGNCAVNTLKRAHPGTVRWSQSQPCSFDVMPDGQRFLVVKASDSSQDPQQLVVIQHFDQELKQRVPTK